MQNTLCVTWLGRQPYRPVWELQHALRRKRAAGTIPDVLLLLEHDPVITMGTRETSHEILLPPEELASRGVAVLQVERGGEVTYHGPGQLVAYPILSLRHHPRSVKKLVHHLEEVGIRVVARYGIRAERDPRYPGLWVEDRKIMAIGIAIREGITFHGIALNVHTDLEAFSWIVPCGIRDRGVTSIARETGKQLSVEEIARAWEETFLEVFGYRGERVSLQELLEGEVQPAEE
ncbi:lipoyl(octanoyl) transferase LipB [Spirochaeta thermophila]|uniref:Octanoyltransferase n=1 Tax=Winmispira thermophila (strain ATCC 49972 / DSM 6192 / RI 19.B1) TaxID=665571 RepID=E0RQ49_WINT6|nr:lipoyl(octanoyl) transferase LipB [Spirochaeta thermophila]ADN01433.1 lipoyltransferase [Spirochaeta thermophila DSM 6192]